MLGIWLVFVLLCLTVPPLFHKTCDASGETPGTVAGQRTADETAGGDEI